MLTTVRAVVRDGEIELLEDVHIAEGTEVIVTVLSNDEADFWQQASNHGALAGVWNNDEDDVYVELLKE